MKHIEKACIGLKRKEKNGYYFCIPTKTQFPMFINSMLYSVYKLCDNQSAEYVVSELEKKYPDVEHEKIETDVVQSLWYLYNIGLITQPDKVLNIKNSKIKQANELRILDEQDFKQATDFIKHLIQNKTEGCIIHLPIEMEKIPTEDLLIEYSIPKLRMDHVMGKQNYFNCICQSRMICRH